uniref:40S ribosomal protein S24-2 n=1 Tax=Rhizophora mucronata TaxID=61149 RepID=A0A2P2KRC1_RHIMU
MADKAVTIRTRKFMTNRLLSRKQFVRQSIRFSLSLLGWADDVRKYLLLLMGFQRNPFDDYLSTKISEAIYLSLFLFGHLIIYHIQCLLVWSCNFILRVLF